MRSLHIGFLAALGIAATFSVTSAQQAATPRPGVLTDDFGGVPNFEVAAQCIDWAVGRTTEWHTHPGDETALVIAGELQVEIEGVPTRIVNAGEAYHNKMGQVHRTTNISAGPARTWAVFVVEKSKPRNTNAAMPPGYAN